MNTEQDTATTLKLFSLAIKIRKSITSKPGNHRHLKTPCTAVRCIEQYVTNVTAQQIQKLHLPFEHNHIDQIREATALVFCCEEMKPK